MHWLKALSEATMSLLRQSDSETGRRRLLQDALDALVEKTDDHEDEYYYGSYCWIVEIFDDTVVYSHGGQYYQVSYTLTEGDQKTAPSVTLGSPQSVEVAYVPLRKSNGVSEAALLEVAPRSGEEKDDFLSRCMGSATMRDEFPRRDQRYAVCESAWSKAKRKKKKPSTAKPTYQGKESAPVLITGEVMALRESAVADDGTIVLKLIQPGWGASGYYPADMLERDGPTAFPTGTKMYWDHPTELEEQQRPEGSLDDLAAELTTDASWEEDGPAGPGLYAQAKAFSPYREAIEELAPHTGVSIRASGFGRKGVAEGRAGDIIERIDHGHSVDFVTIPGAGGQVLSLFESIGKSPKLPPVLPPGKEAPVTLTPEEAAALRESNTRLTSTVESLVKRLARQDADRDALKLVAKLLGERALPSAVRERIVDAAEILPVPYTAEDGLDSARLTEAVTALIEREVSYASRIAGTGITGLGSTSIGTSDMSESAFQTRLDNAFKALGLKESTRKLAVAGRQN